MGHIVEPLGDDKVYYTKRIDPLKVTFNETLQFAELLLDSFADDDLFHYWYGRKYRYDHAIKSVRQSIKDPRERLDAYVETARNYKRLTRAQGRDIRLRILSCSDEFFGLYTQQEGYERAVGLTVWRYPKYMQQKTGIWHKIYATWTFYKYKVIDFFEFFGQGTHPLNNKRGTEYFQAYVEATQSIPDTPEEGDRLSTLTEEQLAVEPYREQDYVYLALFMISPDYQRRGLGTRFFEYSLTVVRNVQTPFVSKDGLHKSFGPSKQLLAGTTAGRQLYLKYGFKDVKSYAEFPGVSKPSHRMERVAN
jgi:GNAT superfamily N-acetyltransferase